MKMLKALRRFVALTSLLLAGFSLGVSPERLHAEAIPEWIPEWLNDPYFFPHAEGTESGYHGQWHLYNQMPTAQGVNAGYDANLLGAWMQGFTGAGVIIGIVDDGVQGNHPDLIENFKNAYSWDFARGPEQINDPFRPLPQQANDNHGTSVAGVAAARGGNGIGGLGAAPSAGVAGLRLDFSTEDEAWLKNEAAAILYQGGDDPFTMNPQWSDPEWSPPVRVKNHSYGWREGFQKFPNTLVEEALQLSSDHGVIHVFGAGNYRPHPDFTSLAWPTGDANKSKVLTAPNIIIVAALGSDGRYADYSSYGANVFVTAPSSSGAQQYEIVTTDRSGEEGYNNTVPDPYFTHDYDYTSTFTGTSAAAPIVSGIMALGIEANPSLNLRMAQHLLVRTSRVIDEGDTSPTGGWVTNGAGFRFNNNYGFGLIDAGAFTRMATQVKGLSDVQLFEGETVEVGEAFSDAVKTLSVSYTVDPEALGDEPLPLEYVRVRLSLSGFQADYEEYLGDEFTLGIGALVGDLSAWLTSPSGTRNLLFTDDRGIIGIADDQRNHALSDLEWSFLSYAYWGESLLGEWTLELSNSSPNSLGMLGGIWNSASFEFGMGEIYLIPEPSGLLLLGLGLGGCLLYRRRKRIAECFKI